MFCKACGNEVLDTSVICPKCGSATGGNTPVDGKTMITTGWICTFLFPVVGLIIGIINLVKGRASHGIGQIVVSMVMWAVYTAMFLG